MNRQNPHDRFHEMARVLDSYRPTRWHDIVHLLNHFKNGDQVASVLDKDKYLHHFAKGTAIITFNYGIDGVSIEISKYAQSLEDIYRPSGEGAVHLIGGNFHPQASSILRSEWHWQTVEGIDGWDKWDGGQWFNALYIQQMESRSEVSKQIVEEMFRQAVLIAKSLGSYFVENQISLLIPVNIGSNPGNFALTLGVVFATEALGMYVLNSNHDFYWEGGQQRSERVLGEKPGIRDHFFRNENNVSFFSLFELLYPWNGKRWLQVNINARQSRTLIEQFGFPAEKVTEISTSVSDKFFEDYNIQDVKYARLRMGHILSGGKALMRPVPIVDHVARIDQWMQNQTPIILGSRPGLSVDPMSDDLFYLLQPTRIVGRKRIVRNIELIEVLLRESPLRGEFENNSHYQLILHITGPTPEEHQADLEEILYGYQRIVDSLPEMIASRIYVAFSVGHDDHPSFLEKQYEPLTIETIYRIADLIVFPSETEGRGLPIIEAAASGIPIICSRYEPGEVFDGVVGQDLSEELRISYTLFPEGSFDQDFLFEITSLLLHPEANHDRIRHNRDAVRRRYSRQSLTQKFERLLDHVQKLN